jgi:quinol monooxygenase YgiN
VVDGPRFGAVLQLTAAAGRREDVLRMLANYANTLDGEPGTTLYVAAADAQDEDVVWLWEEFEDEDAVRGHFEHDFFRALQLELGELLAGPAAIRPLVPVIRRVGPEVPSE